MSFELPYCLLISIHAPRTGSDIFRHFLSCVQVAISIHAPRTGSDAPTLHQLLNKPPAFQSTLPARGATRRQQLIYHGLGISIHAPRTGSDGRYACPSDQRPDKFQSTLPARGATPQSARQSCPGYFNPRSPHGERRPGGCRRAPPQEISIHAPRTGSDDDGNDIRQNNQRISIHAPRTGSDDR